MRADQGQSVPFYLMDTLGGADNLRGFRESMIGGDEGTSTLRSFESFRFRDRATAFVQVDFRQRVWSQVFASVFADAGMVAPSVARLSTNELHRGVGVAIGLYRTNALVIRAEFSLTGGEGHPRYITSGRGTAF
jgi:outer membrane translocation and assembly module TamA